MTGLEITLAGESLILLPDLALWWPARKTVFIADTHFGKTATFRSHGIPIGDETLEHDLCRLSSVVTQTAAERLVVLGDLLHARRGRSEGTLGRVSRWRASHRALVMELIRGNHDRSAGPPLNDWRITTLADRHREGPFALCHHPVDLDGAYVLAGHLHPKVVVPLEAAGSARLPCFWVRPGQMVLPAFGAFIDSSPIKPVQDDRVYAAAEGRVHDVSRLTAPRRSKSRL